MNFNKKYDVVIVGAGPGGLRCAEILGGKGKSVLLVEKNDVIGPKICAGGLTRKAISYLKKMGIREEIIEKKFNSMIFRLRNFKTVVNFGETFLYTIKRKNLGQWQLSRLSKFENVEVKTGAIVTRIKKNSLIINSDHEVQFDFLVGADGSNSIVRRFLGIETKMVGVAYQYIISSEEYNIPEIIFDSRLFHSWYAWIFPYENKVSIGSGYFPEKISAKKSKESFEKWLENEKIEVKEEKKEIHLINCDYRGYRFNNIFLVGDAAGAASGFTGEGIYQALVFGEEIANEIINKNYKSEIIPEVLHEKRIHEFLLSIVIMSGSLRNFIFYIIVLVVKIPVCGRYLLRILT